MASADVWSDFEAIKYNVKHNRVDRLKQILTGLNEECATSFFKSGRKQEIVDRIVAQLDSWRQTNNADKWVKARAVIYQVRTTGIYSPNAITANPATLPPSTTAPNSYSPINAIKPVNYHAPPGPSPVGRYGPYSPPRKPPILPAASTSNAPKPEIRFKPSPFVHIDRMVSQVVECPESTSATDRRQQVMTFTLNNDDVTKLKYNSSKYQLRLFCTSSVFYSSSLFRNHTSLCPIEFPPTCEVRVNGVQLTANLKGLKKKPGTAPPPDLGKSARIGTIPNRVEMVYVNSQQPIQPKKFYLAVMLVEITTVDQLVDRLKKGKYRSSGDVRVQMTKCKSEDDDIIAGPQKMSLKCPLSFMRVKTPCRSVLCVHSQCFDATSWLSMMEQTTTFLCPVCEKVLNYDDLIVDGYFDEILNQTPESVEDVTVEADGEWHTADGQYGSVDWKTSHPPSATVERSTPRKASVAKTPPVAPKHVVAQDENDPEIVVLDSDDEDEGWVKRELSPSFGRSSSLSGHRSNDSALGLQPQNVIDLTLESDDDEPPVPRPVEKRKATDAGMSPTEQIWKKGRQTHEPSLALPLTNGHVTDAGPSNFDGNAYLQYPNHPHDTHITTHAPPIETSPGQYLNSYSGLGHPAMYHYPAPGTPMTSNPTLSLSRSPYMSRVNTRWPGT